MDNKKYILKSKCFKVGFNESINSDLLLTLKIEGTIRLLNQLN